MKLYGLTVNHRAAPLGIAPEEAPYFGWKLQSEARNTMQTAYRLQIYAGDAVMYDSGRVESSQNAFVSGPEPLQAATAYRWTVTVWDNHGQTTAAESNFETALAHGEHLGDWMRTPRSYVQRKKGFGTQPSATLFRRAFTLAEAPRRARLYATCLGVYRLTVNGRRPDTREFAPEHTSYKGLLCYQTYDLTTLLHSGENVLGMEVGDGWYCCPQTQPPIDGLQPDHTVLFRLEIENADGTYTRICSDEQVLTHESAVRASDIFDGELYDARLTLPGWDAPGFDADGWLPAVRDEKQSYDILRPQYDAPVVIVKELPAQRMYTSPKGETIVDFGQVVAGRTRVTAELPAGASLTLEHFEETDADGSYFNNLDTAMGITEQKDVFISDGVQKTFEAKFTFHGFRYLRVSGLTNPTPQQFTAVVLSTEKPNAGTFTCSDDDLNRLYQNTRWSQCANMLSIPTDCPQREKAGWTGDISLYAKTALLNEDVTPFLTQWLQSLKVDQRENGSVPFTVPDVSIYHYSGITMGEQTGCGGPVCSAGWGDAAVTVPMAMYEVTGNTRILETQYDSMKGWCNYVISRARIHAPNTTLPDEIEEHLWNTGFQFGEWLVPSLAGEPQEKLFAVMAMTAAYTTPIFGWLVVDKIAQVAAILGRDADAAHYSKEAAAMKQAIQTALITPDGHMKYERQGAYVLMLAFGLVPDALVSKFGARLAELIHGNGDRLDTGFLPTPYLLDALCIGGQRELAFTLLYQTNAPSWLGQVKRGATTIWESWEMYLPDGTPKKESFNHYTYGTVDDWIFRTIGGVESDGIGYRKLLIRPQPDKRLTWAARSFETENGTVRAEWKRENGQFVLSAEIPCNTTATIILPDGRKTTVGSGKYTVACADTQTETH
ncbi:family 78 glycoside hydrolase catalytic domain [Gemmiger sp.]